MTVSDAEFEATGSLVRFIDGEIVLGKTEAKTAAKERRSGSPKSMPSWTRLTGSPGDRPGRFPSHRPNKDLDNMLPV